MGRVHGIALLKRYIRPMSLKLREAEAKAAELLQIEYNISVNERKIQKTERIFEDMRINTCVSGEMRGGTNTVMAAETAGGVQNDMSAWWSIIGLLMIHELYKKLKKLDFDLYIKKNNGLLELKLAYERKQDIYKINNPEDVGYFIIINNEKFKGNPRRGSEVDVQNLKACWSARGFEVKIFNNVTAKAVTGIIHKYSKKISNVHAAFAVCILSHGNEGVIYGINNKPIQVNDIKNAMFYSENANRRSLFKLLILQACRGNEAMECINVPPDMETDNLNINETTCKPIQKCLVPEKRDLLIVYPNAYGYVALRHKTDGTPLIMSLCKNIISFGNVMHLEKIIRHVKKEVGESTTIQAPEISSSCTKKFFFPKTYQVSIENGRSREIEDYTYANAEEIIDVVECSDPVLPEELLPVLSKTYYNLKEFFENGGEVQHLKLMIDYISSNK
ncbi:caspase-3-like [Arctopsyche grandis]|uniref:caspase-3-like n=1 Tax=Arctopsyche grandis TaxID=121162 RepID=UPI00406D9A8D